MRFSSSIFCVDDIVKFPTSSLLINIWLLAKDAICGRWLIAITCLFVDKSSIFSPTIWAVLPEIPVSISSNIMVSTSSKSAKISLKASIILEISPPDAVFVKDFNFSPLLVLIKKSTSS